MQRRSDMGARTGGRVGESTTQLFPRKHVEYALGWSERKVHGMLQSRCNVNTRKEMPRYAKLVLKRRLEKTTNWIKDRECTENIFQDKAYLIYFGILNTDFFSSMKIINENRHLVLN